jgi:hypothetical protein
MTEFEKAIIKFEKKCGESEPSWDESFEAGWDAALKFRDKQMDDACVDGHFSDDGK